MKNNKGFSLTEVLIASFIVVFIFLTLYTMIITTQKTHLTEQGKLDMNQAARALDQILYDNIRSSGSVLSMLGTPSFLSAPSPFNGIYPLNNANYSDGIILASGDPDGVTSLTTKFSSGEVTIFVDSTDLADGLSSAWQINDIGIVVRPTGYYVFRVTATPALGAAQLSVRGTAVYYSGLLNTTNYVDLSSNANHLGVAGTGDYISGRPVIRLDYFNIFLTRTETNGSRTLTLTVDCENVDNVLANPSQTRAIPVVPNIQDIQFEYISSDFPAQFWASLRGGGTSNPCSAPGAASCLNFINEFTTKNIASIRVYLLFRTAEQRFKGSRAGQPFAKPRMGDVAASAIPAGAFHYNYMEYEVFVRNFNTIY